VCILLTPNLFFLVEHLCRIVPLNSVIVLGLVLLYTLHEAHVVDVEAIANAITGLTVLILLRIYRVHDHFTVFRGRAGEHGYWILRYILQSLLGEVVQSLRDPQIRVLLDYAHKPI